MFPGGVQDGQRCNQRTLEGLLLLLGEGFIVLGCSHPEAICLHRHGVNKGIPSV